MQQTEGALADVRVLDLTQRVAGPFCTKLLADFGATVLKVERPGRGDVARHMPPFLDDTPGLERSGLFAYLNTNKQSITLNLKDPTGRRMVRALVQEADVVVESFAPRVMPALGLDFASLQAIKPDVILVSISNFGQTGPYRDWQAEELTLSAMGGLMAVTGEPDREPLPQGGHQMQYQAGLNAAVATLTALWARDMLGVGQHVDVALMECAVSIQEMHDIRYMYAGENSERFGNRTGLVPWGLYRCQDGYVGILADPRQWPRLPQLMGSEALASPRYADPHARSELGDEVDTLMQPWLMAHTREYIYHAGQQAGLPFGYVCDAADLLTSPQLKARDYFHTIEHPGLGAQTYPGAPVRMLATPWRPGRAPLLGEHNQAVYCGRLGYSQAKLEQLRARGVI